MRYVQAGLVSAYITVHWKLDGKEGSFDGPWQSLSSFEIFKLADKGVPEGAEVCDRECCLQCPVQAIVPCTHRFGAPPKSPGWDVSTYPRYYVID